MPELAGDEVVEIDAPAAEVWSYRLHFGNLPEYNPDVTAVTRAAAGAGSDGSGAGACYRFTLATPRGPHPVSLTVTAAIEDEEVSATMDGALRATETFRVASIGPGRCRATLSLWLELPEELPPGVRAALLDGGRAQIRAELQAMKAVLADRTVRT